MGLSVATFGRICFIIFKWLASFVETNDKIKYDIGFMVMLIKGDYFVIKGEQHFQLPFSFHFLALDIFHLTLIE